ncbi:hypothetical protein RclHR1_39600001 [Rhizophagus clarus]|uniref:Uncharacterized protein n=1 Tax=Rhizophagus clarus TaxID=94130 RepID=A0A2Z6RW65_9GLOM|nr:hypothetical protein RclHR1_39600001 [Rhizophagus clarus]GES91261.1 hypothetical protein GLOIN_2v1717957 [Rhizophagus clarus]
MNVFKKLKSLPNPIPGPDDHYISFSEAYEKETTEEYCPSLQNKKPRNIRKDVKKKKEMAWILVQLLNIEKMLSSSKKESDVNINDDDEKKNNDRDTDINGDNEKENNNRSDPVAELFKIVQINKKYTCTSAIEKSYFVAKIFPQICNICGILEGLIQYYHIIKYVMH